MASAMADSEEVVPPDLEEGESMLLIASGSPAVDVHRGGQRALLYFVTTDSWMQRSGGAAVGWVDAADAAVRRSCVDCGAMAAAAWTAC